MLSKKKRSSQKFFRRSPKKEKKKKEKKKVFTKIFQAISTKKRFSKHFSSALQDFNNSKNTAVLEPRTGQFSRTWGLEAKAKDLTFEAKAKDFKICPRGRPRGQGRPRGLHLCYLGYLLLREKNRTYICCKHSLGFAVIQFCLSNLKMILCRGKVYQKWFM